VRSAWSGHSFRRSWQRAGLRRKNSDGSGYRRRGETGVRSDSGRLADRFRIFRAELAIFAVLAASAALLYFEVYGTPIVETTSEYS
jgi:hypothetical protein